MSRRRHRAQVRASKWINGTVTLRARLGERVARVPGVSLITFMSTLPSSASVAAPWRRSWKRIGGNGPPWIALERPFH